MSGSESSPRRSRRPRAGSNGKARARAAHLGPARMAGRWRRRGTRTACQQSGVPRQSGRGALARRPERGTPLRRELRAAHRLRLPGGRVPPRRSQENDRRGHGAVRPHGLGRPATHLLGRLGGVRLGRQPDRERPPRPAGLFDRARARARHLHAVQSHSTVRGQLAGRPRRHDRSGIRPAFRQGSHGHGPSRHRGADDLSAPDPGARESLHARGSERRTCNSLYRARERAVASPRGRRGLHPLHQRPHRRRAQHGMHQADLLQCEPGLQDR